jgi:hypothetical protein
MMPHQKMAMIAEMPVMTTGASLMLVARLALDHR